MLYSTFNEIATEEATPLTEPIAKPAEVDEAKWDNDHKPSSSPTNSEAKPSYEEVKEKKSIITEMIQALVDMIGKLFTNLGGRINALYAKDDSSFLTKYYAAKKNYKPDVPLKKETTRCDTKPADNGLVLVRSFVQNAINECNSHVYGSKLNDNSIFEMDKEEFYKAFLKQMKAPDRFTNPTEYFKFLEDSCRGQKGIITITEDQLSGYEKVACLKADALISKLRMDESVMNKGLNQCRNNMKLVSNNTANASETRDRAIKYTRRLTDILNIYENYLKMYNRVKVNKINTARSILNAVYKI